MYGNVKEYTIAPGCPWYEQQQAYGPANVNWCEATRCSIINEPANTWSNLPFLLVAILLITKLNKIKEKLIRDFGVAIFVMGVFSFTYHASNNFFSQFFDFLGMYLMICLPLAIQIKRLRGESPREYHAYFWFLTFFSTCLFWFFTFWGIAVQSSVAIQTVSIVVLELTCRYKERKLNKMKYFWLAGGLLFIAQVFSMMDLKRIWCEPDNLVLHGHAIWHVLSAIGVCFLALHYRQILQENDKR